MMQFIHDNWGAIASALLGISELLSFIPGIKSNGIVQAIINFLKSATADKAAK
jgi:hypothetical protein